MFSGGVPGVTPPPKDRIIPPPGAPLRRHSRAQAVTSSGVPRTPRSSGGTLPISATRWPIWALASAMSIVWLKLNTSNPAPARLPSRCGQGVSLW